MKLLAFDTSTDQLSIAIQHGDRLWEHAGAGGAQSSATLIPAIEQGMQALGLAYEQLDAIVFGRGPGSFTGLRTACAIAQGLGLGSGVPLLPLDTLLAVAEEGRTRHGCTALLAVLDARMHEVYYAGYRYADGRWSETLDLGLCAPEQLPLPTGLPVVGNAQPAYPEELAPGATHLAALPTAAALLRLAPAAIQSGALVAAADALPRYIRDKVAQTTAEREAAKLAASAQPAA
ncbi:MAG: tRNA (adenosine(37)-N6)-threonylcarbamoyltransferase complex dimerization subunit type 1 TsaB [Acidovorax sp.]|jgi:tRNA threonylcarbamoyladenosine biosynthesis protein TsaB|nr:tRNA (adenosine(37)-N6)-threonylcarbamoyltransferase complex dimerization subunit type 1 TsaB [Acidovorax sp.]